MLKNPFLLSQFTSGVSSSTPRIGLTKKVGLVQNGLTMTRSLIRKERGVLIEKIMPKDEIKS